MKDYEKVYLILSGLFFLLAGALAYFWCCGYATAAHCWCLL